MAAKAGRYDEVLVQARGSSGGVYALNDSATVSVRVLQSDGVTDATLYSDRDKTPFSGSEVVPDSAGNLEFFAEPGTYVLEISVGGVVLRSDTVVVSPDPVETDGAVPAHEAAADPHGGVYATVEGVTGHGAVGDGTTDDTAAVQAAIDAVEAAGGGVVHFPEGDYRATADLTVDSDNVLLRGVGYGSRLQLEGARLHLNGEAAHVANGGAESLRITRTGTAGVALDLTGGGSGTGFIRWHLRDLWITSTGGTALRLAGAYLGDIDDCYLRSSSTGLLVEADPVLGTVYAPGVAVRGGEIQGNAANVTLTNSAGVSFHGVAIEGASTSGVELAQNDRGVGFFGCYFEGNAGWDIKVGTLASAGGGHKVEGCYFADGSAAKDHAVTLVRTESIDISGCHFGGYTAEPIDVQEAAAGAVKGAAWNNENAAGTALIAHNGATRFSRERHRVYAKDFEPVSGQTGRIGAHFLWLADSATAEAAVFAAELPPEWETVKIIFQWINTGAGSGGVAWRVRADGLADGANASITGTTLATTVDTALAQNLVHETEVVSSFSVDQGSDVDLHVRIERVPGDAGDTLGNDAGVAAVVFERIA